MPIAIRQLTPQDLSLMEDLLTVFGDVFNDKATYTANRPDRAYLGRLLGGESLIALAALKDRAVVGGLAAYELKKSSRSAVKSISTTSRLRRTTAAKGLQRR